MTGLPKHVAPAVTDEETVTPHRCEELAPLVPMQGLDVIRQARAGSEDSQQSRRASRGESAVRWNLSERHGQRGPAVMKARRKAVTKAVMTAVLKAVIERWGLKWSQTR